MAVSTKNLPSPNPKRIKIDSTMKQLRHALDQWQEISTQPRPPKSDEQGDKPNEDWLETTRGLLVELNRQLESLSR